MRSSVIMSGLTFPMPEYVSDLFWCVPGCPEGAEECQTGMPKTGTVQNAVRLGSEVRGNTFCS